MFKKLGQLDLTQGNPTKQIVLFSIPLIIGNFAQQLYNTVDAIVVSHYIGDNALGAVGASFPIINFIIVLFVAIATGTSVLIGQYYGAKDRENLSKTMGTCLLWVLYASIGISAVGYFVADPLLHLLNTPVELFDMTSVYLKTIFIGVLGIGAYNILTGALRAMGDSIFPLIALLISTLLNVVLDILFVSVFRWGTFGVAIATVIAQTISAILCLFRLLSMKQLISLNKENIRIDKEISKKMMFIGGPSAITQSVFSLAMLLIQGLSNSFGPAVVTANTTVMRIDGFVMLPIFTFGVAATTFTSQNVGAKRLDRVKEGAVSAIKVALTCSVTLAVLILLFGMQFAKIFTKTDEILELSARFLRILTVGYIMFTFTQVFGGVMRGAGDSVTPMWISIFTVVIMRTPLAYIMVELTKTAANPAGNPAMVMLSHAIGWSVSGLLSVYFYKKGIWRRKLTFILEQPTTDNVEEEVHA